MNKEKLLYLLSCIASKMQNIFVGKRFEPRTILIVKLDEIGDMIYALQIFEQIKNQYNNALLNVYVNKINNSLIESTGKADRIINNKNDLEKSYDLIINLRGDWFTFWYGFRCRLRLERGCVRIANKLRGGQTHEVETNFNIVRSILPESETMKWPELRLTSDDLEGIESLLREEQINRFVILHTGARDIDRRWPGERYARLAEWIFTEYHLNIVFGGGPDEVGEIEAIRKHCTVPTYNFAGRTSLTGFGALCKKADLFVGNESGPLHIANVSGTPSVALFGPGVEGVFYPYGENVRIIHHLKAQKNTDQVMEPSSIQLISFEEVQHAVDDLIKIH